MARPLALYRSSGLVSLKIIKTIFVTNHECTQAAKLRKNLSFYIATFQSRATLFGVPCFLHT